MKIAIRDDDTCYFTTPAELERVYGRIWPHVPVCLATIPHAMGYKSPAVPRQYWESGEAFALERNPELVAALRDWASASRISIALHGYTHEDFPDGWEFQAAPDPDRRVRDGLATLRNTLGVEISIFVPPHNALSKAGMAAVSAAGLNLLGSFLSFHPSRRPFEWRTLPNWWRVQQFRSRTGRSRRDPMVFPHVLRYGRHAEFGCHSLIPSSTRAGLIAGFEEARAMGGDFCIATHYWEVDDRLRGLLEDVLAHAARYPDVRFVRAEEIFVDH
jgi:hypothetical protein